MKQNSPEEYNILLQYATTEKQREVLRGLIEHGGSIREYCRDTGRANSTTADHVRAARKHAARKGFSVKSGWNYGIEDGFILKGVSDMRTNEEGKPVWYKVDADKERQLEMMMELVKHATENLPARDIIAAPSSKPEDLLNLYTFSDFHLGMLAWHKEGGADWDLSIAQQVLIGCFHKMMDDAPDAKYGFINILGDFLHYDKLESVTNQSGHVLDADSRFQKIQEAAFDCIEYMIDKALRQHEKVIFLGAEGNHDELSGGFYMPAFFRRLYRDNPRIEVISSYTPYYAYRHGKTGLFFHHGHKKKPQDLAELFAARFRDIWGNTKKCYGHTGHWHHLDIKERSGIIMQQHQTLAAADAYAARGGWDSERKAVCDTYHKVHGLVEQVHVTPEMVDIEV